MKIIKVYNNNVVSCLNSKNEEMIITGAGVGFKKKIGDFIEKEKVTQIFYLENGKKKRIYELLDRIPSEYFEISRVILEKASEKFGKKFSVSIFIPFIDHLSAAIERGKEGITLPNLTLMEIKTIWKQEFEFSLWIIDYIAETTGIRLPIDEAGYFAVYFVSDSENAKASKTMELIDSVVDIVDIIERNYNVTLDKESLSYNRLITHLRFFIGRIKNDETREDVVNQGIYQLLIHNNPKLVDCAKCIEKYIEKEHGYEVSQSEIMYLMIHITQILGK
ncbi:MAG: PRD domain-containing protein [Coprobacillus sp.]